MKTIILRGPSGSGKSTYVKKRWPDAHVVSADDYWMKPNPETGELEYRFEISKIAIAHSQCMNNYIKSLQDRIPLIVVDNTNIHLWEMQNYVAVAESHNYQVEVVEFRCITLNDVKVCQDRATHGATAESIWKMAMEFEPYPGAQVLPIEA